MFVSKLEFAQHKRQVNRIIEMLCENCLIEILDKKITAIKPKNIE